MSTRKIHSLVGMFAAVLCLTGCFDSDEMVEPDVTKRLLQNPKNYVAPFKEDPIEPETIDIAETDETETDNEDFTGTQE